MSVLKVKPGDTVTWTSQAGGVWKEKTGTVVAVVPQQESVENFLPAGVAKSRVKGQSCSFWERVLVAVPRASGKRCDFYLPRIDWVKLVKRGDSE